MSYSSPAVVADSVFADSLIRKKFSLDKGDYSNGLIKNIYKLKFDNWMCPENNFQNIVYITYFSSKMLVQKTNCCTLVRFLIINSLHELHPFNFRFVECSSKKWGGVESYGWISVFATNFGTEPSQIPRENCTDMSKNNNRNQKWKDMIKYVYYNKFRQVLIGHCLVWLRDTERCCNFLLKKELKWDKREEERHILWKGEVKKKRGRESNRHS